MSEDWMIDPEGAFEIDGAAVVAYAIEAAFREHAVVRVEGISDVAADDIARRVGTSRYHRIGRWGWLFQRP